MSRNTDAILAQRAHGLITPREARRALRRLAKQARFNADYSDSLAGYERWDKEARAALHAAQS